MPDFLQQQISANGLQIFYFSADEIEVIREGIQTIIRIDVSPAAVWESVFGVDLTNFRCYSEISLNKLLTNDILSASLELFEVKRPDSAKVEVTTEPIQKGKADKNAKVFPQ